MKHPFDEDSDEEPDVVEPGTTLEDVAIPIKAKDPAPKIKHPTRTAKHKVRPQSNLTVDAPELPPQPADPVPPKEFGDEDELIKPPDVPTDPVKKDFTVDPNQAQPPEEPPPRNDFGPTIGIDDLDQTHPKRWKHLRWQCRQTNFLTASAALAMARANSTAILSTMDNPF